MEREPYFADPDRLEQLLQELESWEGTPFLHRGHVKGVGVDCVQLLGQVMVSCGVVGSYDFGYYALDWSQHSERSLIVDYLEGSGACVRVDPPAPSHPGDVVCFTVGKTVHHCGVMIDELRFVHVVTRGRVTTNQLDDSSWGKRLACFYRPLR